MTLKEKVEKVATFDGWDIWHSTHRPTRYIKDDIEISGYISDYFEKYLSDLNWLHPVAMKALDELDKLPKSIARDCIRRSICHYCSQRPIDGQYCNLFEAVLEAIGFIGQPGKGQMKMVKANEDYVLVVNLPMSAEDPYFSEIGVRFCWYDNDQIESIKLPTSRINTILADSNNPIDFVRAFYPDSVCNFDDDLTKPSFWIACVSSDLVISERKNSRIEACNQQRP